MRVFVIVLSLILSISCCLSHTREGKLYLTGKGGQLMDSDSRHFSFLFAPRGSLDPQEDALYFSVLNFGIACKSKPESANAYFKFKLLEFGMNVDIRKIEFPTSPRIEDKFSFDVIDLDRTGILDVDYKWLNVSWGREYYLFSDTVPRGNRYDARKISDRSLSFIFLPKASLRTFKPGNFAFGELGDECNTMATSLFVGMDIGLRAKLYSLEFEAYLKGDKCLYYNTATLNPGATICYKLPWIKKDNLEIFRLGLNYDLHRVFVNSKSMNVQQLSASITAVL